MQCAWINTRNVHKSILTGLQRRDRIGNMAVDGRSYSDSHKSSAKFHGVDTKYEHLFWNTVYHLLFYCASYRLNMFRALLCPSSRARDYNVDYHIGRFVLGLL